MRLPSGNSGLAAEAGRRQMIWFAKGTEAKTRWTQAVDVDGSRSQERWFE
jgi:hypothetical protein